MICDKSLENYRRMCWLTSVKMAQKSHKLLNPHRTNKLFYSKYDKMWWRRSRKKIERKRFIGLISVLTYTHVHEDNVRDLLFFPYSNRSLHSSTCCVGWLKVQNSNNFSLEIYSRLNGSFTGTSMQFKKEINEYEKY